MVFINRAKIKFIKLSRMLLIPRGHLVLDVGSGDGPFARANILCDKYISETVNRVGPISIDRPFVAGDILALPFRDNSFDYIFCSHVLEHVDDPERALNELMRVGKRGYIEMPSEFLEKLKCSPGHRWYVNINDSTLIFKEKERDVFDPFIQEVSESRLINKDKSFMKFYWSNYYTIFNIAYEWSGKINFEIFRNTTIKPSILQEQGLKKTEENRPDTEGISLKIKAAIKSIIKIIYHKDIDLYELIACPICKGSLELKEEKLFCYNCRKGYYIRDGIPILIESYSFNI
mgnify:CR=1 FL=1